MTLWRARFLMSCFADLPQEIENENFKILATPIGFSQTGEAAFVVDVLLSRPEIKTAFFEAFDILEDFTDAVSFLSFARASYVLLAVSIPSSEIGVPFEIAFSTDSYRKSRAKVSREKLERLCGNKDEDVSIALSAFRYGVSADSPYEVLRELWTSVETMGARSAKASEDYNDAICKCGEVRRIGYKSAKHAKQFFRASELSDPNTNYKKLANDAYDLSNRIEHGGNLRDSALREQAEKISIVIQSAAAIALVEATGIKTDGNRCPRLTMRCVIVKIVRTSSSPLQSNSMPHAWEANVGFSMLSGEHSDATPGSFTGEFGMFFPLPIDPLGYPDPSEVEGTHKEKVMARLREIRLIAAAPAQPF